MDKRLKPIAPLQANDKLEALFLKLRQEGLSVPDAVKGMRQASRLTQPEFAKHRNISVAALRQVETGSANPTVETLNKIASIFGLEVGFVPKRRPPS